ncbi:dihydroorotase [Erysipelothrix urinaevulpis]|uniref:dihydroorotase n=1 Tax=Erysipelothrix urinaevulpis TaxID=2683717 RepID=UPI00135763C5|nr:dihydroorotase [Erysipelothrix urinaevulpis]
MILKNANILSKEGHLQQTDLKIEAGIITEISTELSGEDEIDLQGQLLLPGLIDVHVHLREPGFEHKETIKTGSEAAMRGGFTKIMAMPNTSPSVDNKETLDKINDIIKRDAKIHVHQIAAITKDLVSDELVDIKAMGAIAYSNDGKGVQRSSTMLEAMRELAKNDKILIAHTEDEDILNEGVMHEGLRNQELGLPGILSSVESSQIARDLVLAHQTGAKYHVCHVSTKESVAMIRFAKQMGVDVTCEVTPHHLVLNEWDVLENDSKYKMNPPLRSRDDQASLLEGLLDGTIDMIATDHAPHAQNEKQGGFIDTPFGIIGSEIAFPLLYTKMVKTNQLSLLDLYETMYRKPSERFGFETTGITVGAKADLAVFDLDTAETFGPDHIASKSSNTPFLNEVLQGYCTMTFVKGERVWQK